MLLVLRFKLDHLINYKRRRLADELCGKLGDDGVSRRRIEAGVEACQNLPERSDTPCREIHAGAYLDTVAWRSRSRVSAVRHGARCAHSEFSVLICRRVRAAHGWLWAFLAGGEKPSASRPETPPDATAGSCRAEQRATNPAGLAKARSSIRTPPDHRHAAAVGAGPAACKY